MPRVVKKHQLHVRFERHWTLMYDEHLKPMHMADPASILRYWAEKLKMV